MRMWYGLGTGGVYEKRLRQQAQMAVECEALIMDICMLTNRERREFVTQFNEWQQTQVVNSLESLRHLSWLASTGQPMPWDILFND